MRPITYFTLSLLTGSITALSSGLFVYFKNRRGLVNKTFLLVTIFSAIWSAGYLGMITSSTKAISWRYNWILHGAAILIAPFFVHFALALVKKTDTKKKLLFFSYLISILLLAINPTKLFIQDMKPKFIFNFCCDAGPLYILFALNFFCWTVYALYEIFHVSKIKKGIQSLQLKYALLASSAGFLGGGSVFLLTFNIPFPPYPILLFALYPIITAYAIVRYSLMNINVALTRAGIFIFVYALALGIPFWVGHKTKLWLPSTGLAVFLASIAPFIYTYLKHKAEMRLLHEQKSYQEALLSFSEGMLQIRNLERLIKIIAQMLTRAIRLEHAIIFLQDPESGDYMLKARKERKKVYVKESFSPKSHLIDWLKKEKRPLLYEEASFLFTDSPSSEVITDMKKIKASLIVPSFTQDNLLAFLVMGSKISGNAFTQEDLAVLQVIANQAALAIENAMFYEETGKTLTEQFHEHRLRSIGRMGSYMGHQINNRFHAVLIHAERIHHLSFEKLKPTITNKQKEFFDMAEQSLSIIEENAVRGGAIIDRLKAFSRKETAFKPVELDELINSTLELLACKFDINELNIKVEIEKGSSNIFGDVAQLQDVFFNLLDNAHDAQQTKKENQKDYIPKTKVKAYADNDNWHVEISDNGTGMKKEELEQLFLPFFTTKATAEKGTGIGMAVIKMMVENNKGTIRVESEYGKGAAFYITLPTANKKESQDA